MRMLFLYRGWNSGTNLAVLNAWRTAMPSLDICAYDLDAGVLNGWGAKLRAVPHAVRREGLGVLRPGTGRLTDAVKRSAWCMERLIDAAQTIIARERRFDFSLSVGTVVPVLPSKWPHFLFTDLTILANRYYPDGERRVNQWQECVPYEQEWLRGCTAVFTMSDHVSRSMVEDYGFDPSRVVRVNGGCNTPLVAESDPGRFSRKGILFLGVDWELKGGPEVVEAFSRVRVRFPSATLTIVGCTPSVRGDGIRVVGRVPQAEVPKYLAQASVFCLPSKREAFGISFIEAMRAGLPVISCDLGAAPDFVLDGRTGYRVRPGDVDALALHLEELLSDPHRCERMGQCGKALVESEYTWQRTQQKMWRFIREVLT